jgi:hypothetical protein
LAPGRATRRPSGGAAEALHIERAAVQSRNTNQSRHSASDSGVAAWCIVPSRCWGARTHCCLPRSARICQTRTAAPPCSTARPRTAKPPQPCKVRPRATLHPAVAELIRRHAAPHATVPYFPLTHELDVTCLVLFLRGAPRPPRARPLLSFRVPLRLRSSASHLRTLFAL